MASPEVIGFEMLLAPIAGGLAVGHDPRQDSAPYPLYHQLRDARGKARRAERDAAAFGDIEDETLSSDAASAWQQVLTLSQQILSEQAKDLEIASYLTEALLRRHGFAGLRDAFRLIRLLVEEYWEELYPHAADEGEDPAAVCVKPISDLNGVEGDGTLVEPLRRVPITASEDPGPFSLWQYQNATGARQNPELLEQIKSAARSSAIEFYKDLSEDLITCGAEYDSLIALLTTRCGDAAPHSSNIRSILEDVGAAVRYITRDIAPLQQLGAESGGAGAATAEGPAGAAGIVSGGDAGAASGGSLAAGGVAVAGAIRSREEAFGALLNIAQYFRQAEPHSPISYTLEELVRRGRLPFIDLLKELVPDDEARRAMLLRAGIAPPPSQDQWSQE